MNWAGWIIMILTLISFIANMFEYEAKGKSPVYPLVGWLISMWLYYMAGWWW